MIFNTFLITLPSLGSIGLLLLLILFIYTILGVEMFSMLRRQNTIDEWANFEGFTESFFTLIRVATGEGWNFVMDDMLRQQQSNFICVKMTKYADYAALGRMGCGNPFAYVYAISF